MLITFATGNAHKLQEINEIAAGTNIEFILPPEGFDPVENGETFEENSLIKAREAARLSGMTSLADDSGLCVEALNGAPGIHSARYAETAQARIDKLLEELRHCEGATHVDTFANKTNNLLCHCEGVERPSLSHYNEITTSDKCPPRNDNKFNRRAKFVCVMTLVDANGKVLFQTRGECHGEIAKEQSGVNGFGYDPIFIPTHHNPPLQREGKRLTMAEMSEEEKNEISHRGKALRKVLEYLEMFPPLREG